MEKQMHNFEQVKDILDYSVEFHRELRALYDKLSAESDQTRVKMLLDYLARHERDRADAVARFEKEHQGEASLQSWLQYAPSKDIEALLKDCVVRPDMSVEDVITTALAFDDALIAVYKQTASEADDPKVKALFESLADMEEKEKERFVRDAGWLEDL